MQPTKKMQPGCVYEKGQEKSSRARAMASLSGVRCNKGKKQQEGRGSLHIKIQGQATSARYASFQAAFSAAWCKVVHPLQLIQSLVHSPTMVSTGKEDRN
jgi:hypothetical protein